MTAPTAPVGAPPPDVVAPAADAPDGAKQPPTRRRRRRVFPVVVALVLVLAVVAVVLARSSTSSIPLAPDNPQPGGAQAAATILEREGVSVRTAHTTADAVALAGPGTTLLVTDGRRLDDAQLAAVRDTGADLVLTQVMFRPDLEPLTSDVEPSSVGSPTPVTAQCDDTDATAAGEISRSTGGVQVLGGDVELCFPTGDGTGAFATWRADDRQVSVLADGGLLSNDNLAEAGNAALVLRVLGRHEELVWYLPSIDDTFSDGDGGGEAGGDGATGQLLPPEATVIGWQLVVLAAVGLLWAARRLGPVVTEAMPVVVRSAETTLGRGRLYRRGRAHVHAAAGLRAGFAARTGRALGLPHAAPPGTLVTAVAAATGRDEVLVGRLLYGPPPTTDDQLITLTRELDILESEVHRT
ncbi:DUF4350 domain-containing protein [Georgenia sp. MJ170]|uniref:DUF4350 domain-containing protein n=1 Tax=Georgenia sunbinii TaxID=3117728 RepID=UPI002F267EAD